MQNAVLLVVIHLLFQFTHYITETNLASFSLIIFLLYGCKIWNILLSTVQNKSKISWCFGYHYCVFCQIMHCFFDIFFQLVVSGHLLWPLRNHSNSSLISLSSYVLWNPLYTANTSSPVFPVWELILELPFYPSTREGQNSICLHKGGSCDAPSVWV